jgi:hypothetical protein
MDLKLGIIGYKLASTLPAIYPKLGTIGYKLASTLPAIYQARDYWLQIS